MADLGTDTGKTKTVEDKTPEVVEEKKTAEQQKQTEPEKKVDVEKVKSDALQEFLASLGVEDKEKLQGIVTKAKEEEDAKKSDLEKANDTLSETLKQLSAEREARVLSDAKLEAVKLGARPEMVDDLVIVAKAKVTKDKDVSTVIAEIKDSEAGKFYFANEEEEVETKKNNVTRKRATKQKTTEDGKKQGDNKEDNDDTFASRYFGNKRKTQRESHFFK